MVTKQPLIRSMRTVKRETLKLISGWVSRSNDPQMVSGCIFIQITPMTELGKTALSSGVGDRNFFQEVCEI